MTKEILVITDVEVTKNKFKSYFGNKHNISFYQYKDSNKEISNNIFFDCIFFDLIYLKNLKNNALTTECFNKTFLSLQDKYPTAKKIIMSERHLVLDYILAIKLGIDRNINHPLVVEEIQHVMDLVYEKVQDVAVVDYTEEKSLKSDMPKLLISESAAMLTTIEKIKSVASTKSTVLLTGETGTGKSVLARRIHDLSCRRKKNFISVHCGALAENLIESELFGHEKGSFTGAIKKKLGKFELANEGTIFLDEIGTLTGASQIRLLQVLQERFIQRVGGEENIEIDIRIIAATNSDLVDQVADKSFRQDLYYRLNVFQIEVTPLRKRPEDIECLSREILMRFNYLYKKNIQKIESEVLEAFRRYSWPGNIRELENLIEKAYVLEKKDILSADQFPKVIFSKLKYPNTSSNRSISLKLNDARRKLLDAFEINYMRELLKESNGEMKEASKISGVSIRHLHKFIAKHQINRKQFVLPEITSILY